MTGTAQPRNLKTMADESPEPPEIPFDPEALARRVAELRDQLQPQLPDMDPGDLVLILTSLLRPFGTGKRFFLRPNGRGGHVF